MSALTAQAEAALIEEKGGSFEVFAPSAVLPDSVFGAVAVDTETSL